MRGHTARVVRYAVNRTIWSIPVILLAILLTFSLVRAMPGSPFSSDPKVLNNPTAMKNMAKKYGTDKAWYEQYARYVYHAVQGDFGDSYQYSNRSVAEIIRAELPVSMKLGALAFLLALVVGTGLGTLTALRSNGMTDYAVTAVSTLGIAVPTFIVATYWNYHLFAYSGWDTWKMRIGPICVLAFSLSPYFIRLVRASMLETLQLDYIVTAQAKGLPWRRTVIQHALRNSLIPMVSNAGPLFGFVITGSFIIEWIFNIPGIAREYVFSVNQKDLPIIMGVTVLLSVIIVAVNLAVDLLLGILDPRISHDG